MAIGRTVVEVVRVLTRGRVVVCPFPVDRRLWSVGLQVKRHFEVYAVAVGCVFGGSGDLQVLWQRRTLGGVRLLVGHCSQVLFVAGKGGELIRVV